MHIPKNIIPLLFLLLTSCQCPPAKEYTYIPNDKLISYSNRSNIYSINNLGDVDTFKVSYLKRMEAYKEAYNGYTCRNSFLYNETIYITICDFKATCNEIKDNGGNTHPTICDSCFSISRDAVWNNISIRDWRDDYEKNSNLQTLTINNKTYTNVYEFFSDADSSKKLFYNDKFGILKFTALNGDIWSLY